VSESQRKDVRRFLARAEPRKKPAVRAQMNDPKVEGNVATLRLYDVIDSWGGYWGISATEFIEALDGLDASVTEVHLHINSPGGEVWEGLAIMNALRQHPARVVAVVDAIAASAASFVAMAADEVVMSLGSQMMIHDAMNVAVGNAERMRTMADRLDRESDNIAGLYARKAGGTVEQWREAMKAETWYSDEEAVEVGLADRLDEDVEADEDSLNVFDLSFFNSAGREHAPAPAALAQSRPPKTPTATSAAGNSPKEKQMELTDEQAASLRAELGIADENADGDTILAALKEALAEQDPNDKAEPKASAIPPGTKLIEEATLASLQADAAAGRKAREQQESDARNALVNAAVADGRIAPSKAEAWAKRLAADPTEAETLASLEPGLVPTTEIGHGGDGSDDNTVKAITESPAYKNWSNE
jgi:ATP-dependent protease ClpP protease subunit